VRVPRFLRMRRGQTGTAVLLMVLIVVVLGPTLSPYSPTEFVGAPGAPPGGSALLGTDQLGRDVLSRLLWGGGNLLLVSFTATVAAFVVGTIIGMVAGFHRNWLDPLLMRLVDVILAFPPLLFFLLVATSVGTSELVLIVGVALVEVPIAARVVYAATREISVRSYVEAALVRGERTHAILRREVLPNILGPLIANFGLSVTFSVLMVAAVNFLGLGQAPPAANWALMISENRVVLQSNPWSVAGPAIMIAALTLGVNLLADAIAHALGRSEAEVAAVATRGGSAVGAEAVIPGVEGGG
jgi:peptide/nickel transport system permease protein